MSGEEKENKGMLGILANMTDIRTDLEKHMDNIAQELKDNLDNVIENAIDIILYTSLPSRE